MGKMPLAKLLQSERDRSCFVGANLHDRPKENRR